MLFLFVSLAENGVGRPDKNLASIHKKSKNYPKEDIFRLFGFNFLVIKSRIH